VSAALETVAQAILALRWPRPVRALIDGRSAAGKTTLSYALAERLAPAGRQVLTIPLDEFHPPAAPARPLTR